MKISTIFLLASSIQKHKNNIHEGNRVIRAHSHGFIEILLISLSIIFFVGFKANFHRYDMQNKIVSIILVLLPTAISFLIIARDYSKLHKSPSKGIIACTNDYDNMDGITFESFCTHLLKENGFNKVQNTKATGDQGIDIIAYKGNKKYGFQCKRYSKPVGNKAIQEVFAGAQFYKCDYAAVITNQTFTKSAIELAQQTNVILYDRTGLNNLIRIAKK